MGQRITLSCIVLLTKQNKIKPFILKCVLLYKSSAFGRECLLLPEFDKEFAKMPVFTYRNSKLD